MQSHSRCEDIRKWNRTNLENVLLLKNFSQFSESETRFGIRLENNILQFLHQSCMLFIEDDNKCTYHTRFLFQFLARSILLIQPSTQLEITLLRLFQSEEMVISMSQFYHRYEIRENSFRNNVKFVPSNQFALLFNNHSSLLLQ